MTEHFQQIKAARNYIQSKSSIQPQIALVLGSGLGRLADEVEVDAQFPYEEIPSFPKPTVAGHAGRLLLGTLTGKSVVVMQGRFHFYEGHPMQWIIFPIRVMHALGVEMLVITNAAGGLNPSFAAGDIMLITDHINLMGTNPLIGLNEDALGPRFPDMTQAYDPALQHLATNVALHESISLQRGVYAAVSGPTFETKAERRYLRLIGADAVGMSTVPEVIAANHAGLPVVGLSAITNKATGEEDQQPDSHEEVLAMAQVAGEKMVRMVHGLIQQL